MLKKDRSVVGEIIREDWTVFLLLELNIKTGLSRHVQYSIVNCVHCISTLLALPLSSHDAVSSTCHLRHSLRNWANPRVRFKRLKKSDRKQIPRNSFLLLDINSTEYITAFNVGRFMTLGDIKEGSRVSHISWGGSEEFRWRLAPTDSSLG
jgi:hypothetical protein